MGATVDQANQALDYANEIRLARAALRAKIRSGEIFAASVLLDTPREAQSWSLAGMLVAQRRWGRTRTRRFLIRNQISELKTIGALTERQRRVLAEQLERP